MPARESSSVLIQVQDSLGMQWSCRQKDVHTLEHLKRGQCDCYRCPTVAAISFFIPVHGTSINSEFHVAGTQIREYGGEAINSASKRRHVGLRRNARIQGESEPLFKSFGAQGLFFEGSVPLFLFLRTFPSYNY